MYNINSEARKGYLASYRVPALRFQFDGWKQAELRSVWSALREGDPHLASILARETLEHKPMHSAEERAALLVALASAEQASGSTDHARRHAGRSLDLFPGQWSGHRILLQHLAAHHDIKAAYMHLSNVEPGPVPVWDEPMGRAELHTTLAAWSWMLGDWEQVASHLKTAYPRGIASMPEPIQEDWFRLSLYRDRPQDAVAVASVLIAGRSVDSADELLQTFVQNGWTKQALPLYRKAFKKAPKSQLLRRRLVALCIREGKLDEARALTKPGALDLAA